MFLQHFLAALSRRGIHLANNSSTRNPFLIAR